MRLGMVGSSPSPSSRRRTRSRRVSSPPSKTSWRSDVDALVRDESGQSTVEAALLIPTVMVVLALLLQPACLLYTRSVMGAAAAEGVRVMATGVGGSEACESYVLRRLEAVPPVSIFHSGGMDDWVVSASGPDENGRASVEVVGHVKPLPLFGTVVSALAASDDEGVVLRVRVEESVRSSWVGGDYGDWVGIWG